MMEKIYELYKLIHPPETNSAYSININKCMSLLRNLDNNFNYQNINFNIWKYIILQLSSNLFDYDYLDIIIHPFYDKYISGYKYQNQFTGDKKYVQYIIPNSVNKDRAELHIFIKDLIYEIDSIVIFVLLNILLLVKNKNKFKNSLVLCKDKMLDGCGKHSCDIFPLDNKRLHSNLSNYSKPKTHSKTKKKTHSKITTTLKTGVSSLVNNICNNNEDQMKIIKYNQVPEYTIRYESLNYTKCESKLVNIWNIWCDKIYNIIKDKELSYGSNFDLHVIVGLKATVKFMFKVYPKIKLEKDDELYDVIEKESNKYKRFDVYLKHLINLKKRYPLEQNVIDALEMFYNDNIIQLKYDTTNNCSGVIIPINQYVNNLKKLKKLYDVVYEPILDNFMDSTIFKNKNTYLLCIDNLFGMNSYYMASSIGSIFKKHIKTLSSIGSCGGISNKVHLGDVVLSNNINCWANVIYSEIGKNIYENVDNYVGALKNMKNYKVDAEMQLVKINMVENIKLLIYEREVYVGKSCTGSVIPLETDTLLNVLNKKNYLGIEMENYWIKKGAPEVDGLFMQYASDLPLNNNMKLFEKPNYSSDLYSVNISNCVLRTMLAFVISNQEKEKK